MRTPRRDSGGALLLALIMVLIVAGITWAYLSISLWDARRTTDLMHAAQALYIAEAGGGDFVQRLNGPSPPSTASPFSAPYGGGSYSVRAVRYGSDGVDNDGANGVDDSYEAGFMELVIEGRYADARRRLQLILTRSQGGVYWNAIFAGNSSEDPAYALRFGGRQLGQKGDQRDRVRGDIYSGGHIQTTDDCLLLDMEGRGPSEQVMYALSYRHDSSQGNGPGFVQGLQSIPDIPAMSYPRKANSADSLYDPKYVNVGETLGTKGQVGVMTADPGKGGRALQVTDVNDPAHIFRMNPDDRGALTGPTAKNDYFIEDPTERVREDPNWTGQDAYNVRLSPGTGNERVYYVDGNLWVNNWYTYSMKFKYPEMDGIRLTFVVRGNLYLSDNLFYNNINKDAVAFIAMRDLRHPNKTPADFAGSPDPEKAARDHNLAEGSGNVFFGDPTFGTTERFESFLYAENNFYDNNLGTARSMTTNIYGNMTAGNHVKINRDFGPDQWSRLMVTFDDRIRTAKAVPPDIPLPVEGASGLWTIVSWKQIP